MGEIGTIVTGNTPSKKHPEYYNGNIPWVKPGDINKGVIISETKETLTDEGAKQARIIPEGSIMVTCIGNLGNVAIAEKKLTPNQQINSLDISHNYVDKKFGYYCALMLKPWLVENSTSTTTSMVNKRNFEKAPFPLPPLAEQKRIVSKLDSLFGHLEKLKSRLDGIPGLLKDFRQSVLTQAVTGKLTEEWRKENSKEKWVSKKLKEFSDTRLGKMLDKNKNQGQLVKYLGKKCSLVQYRIR